MNTKYGLFCMIAAGALSASATTVWLENGGKDKLTTGDNLDKIKDVAGTAEVVEIPGLSITAKTSSAAQEINALSESFGVIDKSNPEDERSCFEKDEAVVFSFNKPVHLSGIDFNHFDKDEAFTIQIGENCQIISYEALVNKTTDLFQCDVNIPVETEITLRAEDGSIIGLDALELEVQEADETLASEKPETPIKETGLLGALLKRD